MGSEMKDNWDYVIVGAGSSGAVLASRLSEDPAASVLLLEAGPDYRSADAPPEMRGGHWSDILDLVQFPSYQWPALNVRRTSERQPEPYWRGRGLGGSSSINGMVAIRPPVDEFDSWSPTDGHWSREAVMECFKRLEDDLMFGDLPYHGRGGPITISRATPDNWAPIDIAFRDGFMALGNKWMPDCNEPGSTGVCMLAYNARNEVRISTNDGYLEGARSRPNLTIRGDVLVDRVLFHGTRAIGVAAITAGARTEIFGDEIILSAGAVHSPAILQRSGIGPSRLLRDLDIARVEELPVGDGLQEHPAVILGFAVDADLPGAPNGRHTNTGVRWTSGLEGTPFNDMQALGNGPSKMMPTWWCMGALANQSFGRGSLAISTADPTIDPDVDLNLASDERDLERLRRGIEIMREVLAHPSFAPYIRGEVQGLDGTLLSDLDNRATIDAWIGRVVDGCAHASATCSIGKVVDSTCRVFGVDNLRVIDLSIVPHVPRANTNLTAIMIGEYMSSVIRGAR
jgi:choline dehydrogenase